MNNKEIALIPYLNFQGNCEEALTAYRKILGGSIEIIERYDNPAMQAPEEYRDKVLHARYRFSDNEVYASDVFPGQTLGDSRNVAMSLSFAELEKAKQAFAQLADGGTVNVPFEKQFWGAWHGNLMDKFGIYWMINFEVDPEAP